MKRLVITGFGCPKDPWLTFLGKGTSVISFHDVLEATQSSQMDDWSRYVGEQILRIQPASLVVHDFGATMAIKALIPMQDEKKLRSTKLTVLNAAFREFDILKNPHPFLLQLAPWRLVSHIIHSSGGVLDPELRPWMGTVRKVYRQVIGWSIARKIQQEIYARDKARLDTLDIDLGMPAQIIASSNDPFISMESLRSIQSDFLISHFHCVDYGHFPYLSENRDEVRDLIYHFEVGEKMLHA